MDTVNLQVHLKRIEAALFRELSPPFHLEVSAYFSNVILLFPSHADCDQHRKQSVSLVNFTVPSSILWKQFEWV